MRWPKGLAGPLIAMVLAGVLATTATGAKSVLVLNAGHPGSPLAPGAEAVITLQMTLDGFECVGEFEGEVRKNSATKDMLNASSTGLHACEAEEFLTFSGLLTTAEVSNKGQLTLKGGNLVLERHYFVVGKGFYTCAYDLGKLRTVMSYPALIEAIPASANLKLKRGGSDRSCPKKDTVTAAISLVSGVRIWAELGS